MIQPHPRARQVPVEGGSGTYPTGAIQFCNDWPGLFVRGDDALALLYELRAVLQELRHVSPKAHLGWRTTEVMRTIENDVLLKADSNKSGNA
ncbi:MAG: hypothetical protein P4N60_22285 [Verrucomicrobiae bacterium]|nr:hypothetical protein [Verrucomicrobiae bacterium]